MVTNKNNRLKNLPTYKVLLYPLVKTLQIFLETISFIKSKEDKKENINIALVQSCK